MKLIGRTPMKKYNLDCIKFYGYVHVNDNDVVIETIPMLKVFLGQPLSDLTKWVEKYFKYCTLKEIKNG